MLPSAPVQGVVVAVLNSTSVRVSWTPLSLPETTGYRVVYSSTSDNSSAQYHNVSGDGTTSSTVIGGLVLGEEYQFQVQAVVEVGGEVFIGEKSDIKTVTAGRPTSFILDSSTVVVFPLHRGNIITHPVLHHQPYSLTLTHINRDGGENNSVH